MSCVEVFCLFSAFQPSLHASCSGSDSWYTSDELEAAVPPTLVEERSCGEVFCLFTARQPSILANRSGSELGSCSLSRISKIFSVLPRRTIAWSTLSSRFSMVPRWDSMGITLGLIRLLRVLEMDSVEPSKSRGNSSCNHCNDLGYKN